MRILCTALSRYWTVALALTLSVLAAGCVYSAAHPSEYTAESSVAITARPDKRASASLLQLTTPTYVAYATSEHLLRTISKELTLTHSALRDGVNVQLQPATTTVTIAVTLPRATDAQSAANAIAEAMEKLSRDDPSAVAVPIATAALPAAPSGPARSMWIGASALLGVLLGILLARLLWWWNDVPQAAHIPCARRELFTAHPTGSRV